MSGATAPGYLLRVDGVDHRVEGAWDGESLLYVLRERLGLGAAKPACEQGECGSCSVRLDGVLVCACLVLAAAASGAEVATVEGLDRGAARTVEPVAPAQPVSPAVPSLLNDAPSLPNDALSLLTDVQQAFVDTGAVQCGFCTPGLVMAVHDLLERHPDADELTVREQLAGNLCRCTGYGRILEAVRTAARARRARP